MEVMAERHPEESTGMFFLGWFSFIPAGLVIWAGSSMPSAPYRVSNGRLSFLVAGTTDLHSCFLHLALPDHKDASLVPCPLSSVLACSAHTAPVEEVPWTPGRCRLGRISWRMIIGPQTRTGSCYTGGSGTAVMQMDLKP